MALSGGLDRAGPEGSLAWRLMHGSCQPPFLPELPSLRDSVTCSLKERALLIVAPDGVGQGTQRPPLLRKGVINSAQARASDCASRPCVSFKSSEVGPRRWAAWTAGKSSGWWWPWNDRLQWAGPTQLSGGTVPEVRPEAGKEVLGAAHLPGEPRAGVVGSRAATRRGIFGSRCQVKATVPMRHRLSRAHESWLLPSDRM